MVLRRFLSGFVVLLVVASWSAGLVAQAPKSKGKVEEPPKLATPGKTPEIGDITLDAELSNLISGDGRSSLHDFRGNVVLLDWWGIHCGPCLGGSVPQAYKEAKEHTKDGLVVILCESQAAKSTPDLRGFVFQNFGKYESDLPFITHSEGGLFPSGSDGIPWAAVIGVDGRLLMLGRPTGWGKKLEECLKEEFKKIKSGWGKSPEAKKARALMYGKGNLAEAAKVLADAEGKIKEDAEADFNEARSELDNRYAARKKAIGNLMAAGRYAAAQSAAKDLQNAVKGRAQWEEEVAPLVARFSTPEVQAELALEKTLDKILKSVGDKRPNDEHAKKFEALAKKNPDSKVGARAADFAAAAAWKDPDVGPKKDDDAK